MDSSDSDATDAKKTFKCAISGCNASFSKSKKLVIHTRKHTGERPFICDEPGCDKTYTNSSHLRRHKKVKHGEKTAQTVICEHEGCGEVFSNKYSLKKHCSHKHNIEHYSFKCNECSQGFDRKKQLQQHSGFNCDVCGKTFSHLGNFETHKLVHLQRSEKLVFVCPYNNCKRFYFYKKNLKYHIDNFHKKINSDQSFKCTYPSCKSVLKTKQSLRMHLQRHFQWREKRERRVRHDKGKPKKSIISALVCDQSTIETHLQENNEANSNETQVTQNNIISNFVTDKEDPVLKQCDQILQMLNEQIVAAN